MENINQEIFQIPIDLILEPTVELRSVVDSESLGELAKSITEVGILNPILVRKVEDKYEIVAGHRRYLASKIAGLQQVRCIIIQGSEEKIEETKLHENLHRENINPYDEGIFFKSLMSRFSWSVSVLADKIGKSTTYVYERLALLDFDPIMRDAVRDGIMNISVARELQKVSDVSYRQVLIESAIRSGITARLAQQWRIEWEKISGAVKPLSGSSGEELKPGEVPAPILLPCWNCQKKQDPQGMSSILLCGECFDGINSIRMSQEVSNVNDRRNSGASSD